MKDNKILHVVAFNIPYPPDYGGVIDIYYKIKAFNKVGIKVILHNFLYNRKESSALENICHKVFYYKRSNGLKYFLYRLPYIVITRKNDQLQENLLNDNHPVLFEALHTTFYMENCRKASKKIYVRTHNIEHNYYKMLARSERFLIRKMYFRSEAQKLKKYENVLAKADRLFSISKTDTSYFNKKYGNSTYISAFHQHNEINSKPGIGDYILFHGNLSVPENEKAMIYLIRNVFSKIPYRVIIAGKNPSGHTSKMCRKYSNIELIADPNEQKMNALVNDAHINLLYTYQPTGLKLKLLHSLYGGRYCMANPLMLSGSGLDDLCEIYRSNKAAVEMIKQIMDTPFTNDIILKRMKVLRNYENEININKMIDVIFKNR